MKGSFGASLAAYKLKVQGQLTAVVLKITFDALGRIVMRSPVDTGRFQANNQVNINTLPAQSVMAIDKNGTMTVEAGKGVMLSYKLGDTVFIYNNVAYALALEEGHSNQAPAGIYRVTALEIAETIERVVKVTGGV